MPHPVDLADRFTYRVFWSEPDAEFVALCEEFPSLSWLAPTREKALAGLLEVVRDVIADLQREGATIPAPLAARRYSGTFKVRVPPTVHRQLVLEATEAGVSLNRLVSAKLAHR